MSAKRNSKQPSRWTAAVDNAQSRAYSLRRKAATVAVTALAVMMGYHVVFGQNGLTAYEKKRQDKRTLQLQMQDLQRENDRLSGHVTRLQNDPGAIEHQAREELHYTRAGEVIYTLPGDPKTSPAPAASKPQ
jgi:cell division protein FtsB